MPDSPTPVLGAQKSRAGAAGSAITVLTGYALARLTGIVEPPSDDALTEAIMVLAGAAATAIVTAWQVWVWPNLATRKK